MKTLAIAAMLLAVVLTAACVWNNKAVPGTAAKPSPAANLQSIPTITYVTDSQNVFDQSSRNQLETTRAEFKKR